MSWEQIGIVALAVATLVLCGWLFIGVLRKNEGSEDQ